ncbi:hypothetical protein B0H14DRAFT_2871259, partial [Mycena olivaceomarginata]
YFQQEVLIFICAVGSVSFVHASDLPSAATSSKATLRQDHTLRAHPRRGGPARRDVGTAAATHPPAEQRAQREI